MKALLAALVVGVWGLLGVAGYHVFVNHALSIMYVCATPEHHLPDPGPPPGVAPSHPQPEMPVPLPPQPK